MKKLILILIIIFPFIGFAQFEAGEYVNADTIKKGGVPVFVNHLQNLSPDDSSKIPVHKGSYIDWESAVDEKVLLINPNTGYPLYTGYLSSNDFCVNYMEDGGHFFTVYPDSLFDVAKNSWLKSGDTISVPSSPVETDPKYSADTTGLTTNYLVKKKADGFSNSSIFDTGTNVGISNASPGAKLDIIGTSNNQFVLGTNRTDNTAKYAYVNIPHYSNSEERFLAIFGQTTEDANEVWYGGGSGGANAATTLKFYTAPNNTTLTGLERFRITPTGNVGIGTTTPSTKLDVNGVITATGGNSTDWNAKLSSFTEVDPKYATDSSLIKTSIRNLIADTSNYLRVETDPVFSVSLANDITASDTTRWGVNSGTPNTSTTGYILKNKNDTIKNSVIFEDATGNIGIGTEAPSTKFHFVGDLTQEQRENPLYIFKRKNPAGESGVVTARNLGSMNWEGWDSDSYYRGARIQGVSTESYTTTAGGTKIALFTTLNGTQTLSEKFSFMGDGNLGINTTAPLSKLVTVGSIATNLNMFNFVNSDVNKIRTTIYQATDTSSFGLKYSQTGSPTLELKGKTGNSLFLVDSAGLRESDPIYSTDSSFIKTGVRDWNSSLAKTIDTADTTRWGAAGSMVYPGAGIPISTGSAWGTSIANNSANWDAGYTYRVTGATAPVLLSSNTISMTQADATHAGYLSYPNFVNFQAGYDYRLTSASGTAPLTLNLSANGLTGSIAQATSSTNGYLSSSNWTTFWNKQAAYAILTTLGSLSNASGVLTNNGSGTLSWGAAGTSQWTTDTYGITYANNVGIGQASGTSAKLLITASGSVHGISVSSASGVGLWGTSIDNYGVVGSSTNNFGVYGLSTNSYGGVFGGLGINVSEGTLRISGIARINADGSFSPPTLTDAAAANNTMYYSSTQSKLVYKDSGGTVHALY
jgi:hypothetical protein